MTIQREALRAVVAHWIATGEPAEAATTASMAEIEWYGAVETHAELKELGLVEYVGDGAPLYNGGPGSLYDSRPVKPTAFGVKEAIS